MLTPIDIQNHVLKSTMGGYNKKPAMNSFTRRTVISKRRLQR